MTSFVTPWEGQLNISSYRRCMPIWAMYSKYVDARSDVSEFFTRDIGSRL